MIFQQFGARYPILFLGILFTVMGVLMASNRKWVTYLRVFLPV